MAAGVIGALTWAIAYGITGGQALLILMGLHVALGVGMAAILGVLGRSSWLPSFAGTLMLSLVAPLVIGLGVSIVGTTDALSLLAVSAVVGLVFAGLAAFLNARRWAVGLQVALALVACAIVLTSIRDVESHPAFDLVRYEPAHDAPFSRVAVIGVDGGDWSVIDVMIDAGELPNFESLVDRGAHGVLRSIDPMYSPVVWTTIFSGLTPDQHGIRDWYGATATNRHVPLLWEAVGASHSPATVLNVPGSWPPREFEGAIVAGFPMPRLVVSETELAGQFLGRLVSARERKSDVPSLIARVGTQSVPLGREQILARSEVQHPLLEAGILRRRFLGAVHSFPLTLGGTLDSPGALSIEAGDETFSLSRGEWSPWLDVELGGQSAFIRMNRLDSGDLYITPPFQTPSAPRFQLLGGAVDAHEIAPDDRYIVEGVGWKAATDPEIRRPLVEHLEQTSDLQYRAAKALATRPFSLFGFVFTLPDRVSHGFWTDATTRPELVDPSGVDVPANWKSDFVRDAYRRVDRDLGELVDLLGPDTTVFVVSDHGFTTDHEHNRGMHRAEGIFIAAGPGIDGDSQRLDLSVYDIAPTVLAGLGLPVAENMAHGARLDLFEDELAPSRIATYGEFHDAAADAGENSEERIDASTEEQLRALGYIE